MSEIEPSQSNSAAPPDVGEPALRSALEAAREQQRALADRVTQLERELRAGEYERELTAAQQDEFLAALLDEHEVTEGERDEARTRAARYELERDQLRAEASRLRASLGVHRQSTNPPPVAAGIGPPSFFPTPPLQLDDRELEAMPQGREFPRETTRPGVGGRRSTAPRAPSAPPPGAWTPAPPAPDGPATRSPWPVSAATLPPEALPSMPVLKRKPDASTRPLVDYSLGEGGVDSELLEGAKLRPSKPPQK